MIEEGVLLNGTGRSCSLQTKPLPPLPVEEVFVRRGPVLLSDHLEGRCLHPPVAPPIAHGNKVLDKESPDSRTESR